MLDYNEVKKFHAKKLAEDAEGDGRVESAFYHTMKMVYDVGVVDGVESTQNPDAVGIFAPRDAVTSAYNGKVLINASDLAELREKAWMYDDLCK